MLKNLLICDANGMPFYSREFGNLEENLDPALLSGLISAIGSLGQNLFHKELATINFGEGRAEDARIVIVSKDLFARDQHIAFVFFSSCDDASLKTFREVATAIFIEVKNLFQQDPPDVDRIAVLADKVIDHRFNGLAQFCE